MTDEKIIDLQEVDAVEYAASIGHSAAGQLFYVLSGQPKGFRGDWIGCNPSEQEELEQRIYELANYVAERDAGGARLWQKARIDGVIVEDLPESMQFSDAPLPRQWAYDMFATVSLHAFLQISRTQKAARDAAALAATENPGLKLEDSIFEPEKPLDYMDPHAKQFLQDQAAAELARLDGAPQEMPGRSIGGIWTNEADHIPPALSVGEQQGQKNAQDAADEGQEASGEEKPDPDAQGDVSELADDADPQDGEEGRQLQPPQGGENSPPAQPGEPLEQSGSKTGAASHAGTGAPVKPAKAKSRKSPK